MPSLVNAGTTALAPNSYGAIVGLTSGLAVPPNPSRGGLMFFNNGNVIIAVCPDRLVLQASAGAVYPTTNPFPTGGVASINGAGSINLAPGQSITIDNLAASGQWNAISNGPALGALTILEFS